MSQYEILSKEMQFIDDYVDCCPIYNLGQYWDIIEAETPAKAKYKFWQEYLGNDFIADMQLIESCKLYRCPVCRGMDYDGIEEDAGCQFCATENLKQTP